MILLFVDFFLKRMFLPIYLRTISRLYLPNQSSVTIGINNPDYTYVLVISIVEKSFYPDFSKIKGSVWVKPKKVGAGSFRECPSKRGLRQPVYKGIRTDKCPNECITF